MSVTGSNGLVAPTTASIANVQFLFSQPAADLNAFSDRAEPTDTALGNAFGFGVPFFFGKSVFTAFEQRTTLSGSGRYFAFQPSP